MFLFISINRKYLQYVNKLLFSLSLIFNIINILKPHVLQGFVFYDITLLFIKNMLYAVLMWCVYSLVIMYLVFCPSGDRAVQTSRCGNLSVESVCCPSALQRLLVCSVHCPAVLGHHVSQPFCRQSGNHVLPAHKV